DPCVAYRHDPASSHTSTPSLHDALPIYRSMADAHGEEIGFVDGECAGLLLALAHQLRELQGYDVRGRFPCGNRDTPGRQFIILRSEEHTSELQSRFDLVCRLLLEKKKAL